MRKRLYGGVTGMVVGVALAGGAAPAHAAAPAELFVNNVTSACTDAGTGAQTTPYCTISTALAAVLPGGTVTVVGAGIYNEHLTIDKSGTPGAPIVLRHQGTLGTTLLKGDQAGITVDGQHDVSITGFNVVNTVPVTSLVTLHNSSGLTLNRVHTSLLNSAAVGIQLSGVTDSTLTQVGNAGSTTVAGLALDATTARVRVASVNSTSSAAAGIDVAGSDDTIVAAQVDLEKGDGITVEPGAKNTVIANSTVTDNQGAGIHNAGATGTAIANNTLRYNCGAGIRVDGASTGVSVQNSALDTNGGLNNFVCPAPPPDGVEIGVYDTAVNGTVVDYNAITHGPGGDHGWAWNTPMSSLAQFQSVSGQGAHDTVVSLDPPATLLTVYEDSANSAAPGYQTTDANGRPREDDPGVPNTGAGPVGYADRGATETVRAPVAKLAVAGDTAAMTGTADASASAPGFATLASYTFDFGDGSSTVTQTSPVATHHYTTQGQYFVKVTVTDSAGLTDTTSALLPMWHPVRTIALLSRSDNRYVTAEHGGDQPLIANRGAVGGWELFDVVQPATGYIGLRSHANGLYVGVDPSHGDRLVAGDVGVAGDTDLFQLGTNADGSISLYSKFANAYVTAESAGAAPLMANRARVGQWEEFYPVDATNTGVSLRALADNQFVAAESAGTQPLIANRSSVGQWETFDVVDAGSGYVALYAHADGRFVTADNGGANPLIANRQAVGLWEKFQLVTNADGTVSLLAAVNNRYVTAEAAGSKPLVANRAAIGPWEKFTLNR